MTTEWINKYQPKKISDLITNTTAVRTLSTWLGNYEKRKRDNLKADKKQKKKKIPRRSLKKSIMFHQ